MVLVALEFTDAKRTQVHTLVFMVHVMVLVALNFFVFDVRPKTRPSYMKISCDVSDFDAVTLNVFLARQFSVEFDQLLLGGIPCLPVVQSLR